MQYLHWGGGRLTPKPATSSFCSWIPGSRSKRKCSTVLPAGNLQIERLPRSDAEAKGKFDRGRKYNLKEGLNTRYDIFGDSKKMEKLNAPAYTSAPRLDLLFTRLRLANGKANDDSDSND
jgi:hypothetical protein